MKKDNPLLLNSRLPYQVSTLLYDYLSFVLFLIFVGICLLIGRPLYFIDRQLNTRLTDRLIRFFEFFAR